MCTEYGVEGYTNAACHINRAEDLTYYPGNIETSEQVFIFGCVSDQYDLKIPMRVQIKNKDAWINVLYEYVKCTVQVYFVFLLQVC